MSCFYFCCTATNVIYAFRKMECLNTLLQKYFPLIKLFNSFRINFFFHFRTAKDDIEARTYSRILTTNAKLLGCGYVKCLREKFTAVILSAITVPFLIVFTKTLPLDSHCLKDLELFESK